MDKIEVTQADRDFRSELESAVYAANDGGAFISDDALEIIARNRISHTPQTVDPVATDVAALVEAAKALVRALDSCVDLTPSVIRRVEKALAPFTKGQDDA